MPPQQRLLASKLRGFVCRSCLSKLQVPQRHRPAFAIQSFATDNGSTKQKGATGAPPRPTVRYFDETPDGVRKEIPDDIDEESLIKALEDEIGPLPEGAAEAAANMDEEDMQSIQEDGPFSLPIGDWVDAALKPNFAQEEELKALAQEIASVDLNNITKEDRSRLRKLLLKDTVNDNPPIPKSKPRLSTSAKTYTVLPALPDEHSREPASSATTPEFSSVSFQELQPRAFHIPVKAFPETLQPRIQQLNDALQPHAPKEGRRRGLRSMRAKEFKPYDGDHLLRIWKAYSLSRNALMSTPASIPPRTWRSIWNIFQVEGLHNLDRMARIKTLGDDMKTVREPMDMDQQLLYLEASFIEGGRQKAIEAWRNYNTTGISRNPRTSKAYWELGVRMLAQNGQPDEALEAAVKCTQVDADPTAMRIFLPVIRAYLTLNTGVSVKRAWALYIRLRIGLADQMNMEDYDALTSMFLQANQPDLALGAFKDMMLTGQASVANEDSTALYKNEIGYQISSTSMPVQNQELDWQSSRSLSQLPSRFNNKFFFGKWIKKLIGEGELEAAATVFDLMSERRIRPSAIQLNGLIGAWFREGDEKHRVLAEDMAWKMIRARLDFVRQRDRIETPVRLSEDTPVRPSASEDLPSNKDLFLTPSATIETFCILITQYRRRQRPALMSDLFEALKTSRIRPTTQFMNELLLIDKRGHDRTSAAHTYQMVTEEEAVTPNFETYEIMWDILQRDVDPITGKKRLAPKERHRKCRELFADMIAKLPASGKKEAFPPDLYHTIIQTFSLAQDLPGTAVALHALRQRFGMFPKPETARGIVLQLARLGLTNESGHSPRRLDLKNAITQDRIASVTAILQNFKDERVAALLQQGIVFEDMPDAAKLDETLSLLSELLRFADRQNAKEKSASPAARSKGAANQMRVDCIPWETHTARVE